MKRRAKKNILSNQKVIQFLLFNKQDLGDSAFEIWVKNVMRQPSISLDQAKENWERTKQQILLLAR